MIRLAKVTVTTSADLTVYNLTIDGIHTYYAGTTPTLVHNSCGPNPSTAQTRRTRRALLSIMKRTVMAAQSIGTRRTLRRSPTIRQVRHRAWS